MVPAFRGRKNKKDRENIKVFPNTFINMIQFKEEECSFSELANLQIEEYFNSIYIQLKDIGIIDILENMSKSLINLRNSLDHCWTDKADSQ